MVDQYSLERIAASLESRYRVTPGRWLGLPCLKVGGRVFAVRRGNAAAFKLPAESQPDLLMIDGARRFDPRNTGHPWKRWIELPASQAAMWPELARAACEHVAGEADALKEDLISGLIQARNRILEAIDHLSDGEQAMVFLGAWSVQELIAHLIGWDYTNSAAVQEILDGRKPDFWRHHDRDWRSYNAGLVSRYGSRSWSALIAAVLQSHAALIDTLRSIPAHHYLRHRKIVSLLRAEAKDEGEHYRQIVHAFLRHS